MKSSVREFPRRTINIDAPYLHLPVRIGAPRHWLEGWIGGTRVFAYYLELADEGPATTFFLDMQAFAGCRLTLVVTDNEVSGHALEGTRCGDAPQAEPDLYPDLYREAMRPQQHFTSRRGWLNDPNGLVYDQGIYHLYYQHNPLGIAHGAVNVSWGHAVSRDLVHWEERSDAIMPWQKELSIASGSAVVDEKGAAGFGEGAIIAAFTALGTIKTFPETGEWHPSDGHYLAASTDGGQTFIRFGDNPVVPTLNGESWRDPRLIRYDGDFVMAVYEVREGRNCVAFYRSADCHHWRPTGFSPDLFECPDLFELPCADGGDSRWILYGADGMARFGKFDGETFIDEGQPAPLDYGTAIYAGQTWSGHPEGKRVHIAWVRSDTGYSGMPFSQCMSLPCELTLRRRGGGYRIGRRPVAAGESLREKPAQSLSFSGDISRPLEPGTDMELTVVSGGKDVVFQIGETIIRFSPEERLLQFPSGNSCPVEGNRLTLRLVADVTTVECFFDGDISATYDMKTDGQTFSLSGAAEGKANIWKLSSIWDNQR